MDFIAAFFSTALFWWLFVPLALLFLVTAILDRWFWAWTEAILGSLLLIYIARYGFPSFHWIADHWGTILLCVIAYVIIGPIWSLINWRVFYMPDKGDDYEAMALTIKANYDSYVRDWNDAAAKNPTYDTKNPKMDMKSYVFKNWSYPPQMSSNKARILGWAVWWPVSAAFTLSHKPLIRIYNAVLRKMTTIYNKIATDYFANRFEELK